MSPRARTHLYILDADGTPVPAIDTIGWARWFEHEHAEARAGRPNRVRVAYNEIGGVAVSTVFLGIDHNFGMSTDRRPVLFETMIFGGSPEIDESTWRTATRDEALAQHAAVVALIKATQHTG